MKVDKIDNHNTGWFIGNFDGAFFRSALFELGVKKFRAGECEQKHIHVLLDEFTVVLKGTIRINDNTFTDGSIIHIAKNETCKFEAVTDCEIVVCKTPSIPDDKKIIE
jgi:quercetin dioxygenase-like cupin family protein